MVRHDYVAESAAGGAAAASLRVLVVDDHKTFADLLSLALSSEPDLECVGTAGSAAEAVAMAAGAEAGHRRHGHRDAPPGRAGRHPAAA